MREIKFRGKDFKGKWIVGNLNIIRIAGQKRYYILPQKNFSKKESIELNYIEVVSKTVGQFIGLKDKNGKEVYEGDIVKNHHNIPRKIIFEDGCFVMQDIQKREDGKQYTDFMALYKFIWNDGYEIIGNIYDNPELIGGF